MSLGVGLIGAGPGVWALHLPTLAALPDTYRVTHVADAGSGRAAELASHVGAKSSQSHADVMADPEVDIVAICSPPDQHAEQVLAAVEAGKQGILCEKPLCTSGSDVTRVVEACRRADIPLLVATNHLYDAAWRTVQKYRTLHPDPVMGVSVTLALAPNDRYHHAVSEPLGAKEGPPPPRGLPDLADPGVAAGVVRQLLAGLAVHDVPLLRELTGPVDRVVHARAVPPLGYSVALLAAGVPVQMTACLLPEGPDSLWRITAYTAQDRIEILFPPPFVHAGGGSVAVRRADGTETTFPVAAANGYLAEWRTLARMVSDGSPNGDDHVLEDARWGLDMADAAAALVVAR